MIPVLIEILAIGYAFGSIPSGYIISRIANVDIRTVGSGNIGATNVLRTLGKKFGYTVLFLDAVKGAIAVELAKVIAQHNNFGPKTIPALEVLAALTCVIGHAFPVWLSFRGGKGVATAAGAMAALAPIATLIAFAVWVVTFELTRYVSLASIVAAITLPAAIGVFLIIGDGQNIIVFASAAVIAALVCWRHRSNFSRLLSGKEQRFDRK